MNNDDYKLIGNIEKLNNKYLERKFFYRSI